MKKIDLHIHTIPTLSDKPFDFELDKLNEYVSSMEIDCIAITNHNLFNLEQYESIKQAIPITIYPGIEVDLDGGHILIISDGEELTDFATKCDEINQKISSQSRFLTIEEFKAVFVDLSRYLIIQHYFKKPQLKIETIDELIPHVTAGEVTSPKKFCYCIKDNNSLVPVCFSDLRPTSTLSNFPTKQTYVLSDDVSFKSLKYCLQDKAKVFLSEEDGHSLFNALDNGLKLTTGLNVVLGERSSGKTYTLERLSESFDNVKYIKQFSLVEKNESLDEKHFNNLFTKKQSLFTKEHLRELQTAVDSISDVYIDKDKRDIDTFINSLIKNAKDSEKADSYSKATLYSESRFTEIELDSLKKLITSVLTLIDNTEYRSIIDKYISFPNLKKLVIELISKFTTETESNLKKRWVNELAKTVQSNLQIHTASPVIEDLDLYQIALNRVKVEKFNELIKESRKEKTILSNSFHGFRIVAQSGEFTGALELKNLSGKVVAFSDAYTLYQNPYGFLQELRKLSAIEEAEYYKYFTKIKYSILNKHGFSVSGGERSEFRLLQEINDAQQFDILLIDEPESSFDNLFLKNEVNELIKNISLSVPVVLVTHNNTVGASIRPDFILYTQKIVNGSNVEYNVFSGYPADKLLTGLDSSTIKNIEILLNCLEAGELAYHDRGNSYEILKN